MTVGGDGPQYSANCKQLCTSVQSYLCALPKAVDPGGRVWDTNGIGTPGNHLCRITSKWGGRRGGTKSD